MGKRAGLGLLGKILFLSFYLSLWVQWNIFSNVTRSSLMKLKQDLGFKSVLYEIVKFWFHSASEGKAFWTHRVSLQLKTNLSLLTSKLLRISGQSLLTTVWKSCSLCFESDKVYIEWCFPRPNFQLAKARQDPVCSANFRSVGVRAKRGSVGREQFGGSSWCVCVCASDVI